LSLREDNPVATAPGTDLITHRAASSDHKQIASIKTRTGHQRVQAEVSANAEKAALNSNPKGLGSSEIAVALSMQIPRREIRTTLKMTSNEEGA
jgi:hypothetical protein